MISRLSSMTRAHLADALTAARFVAAVVVFPVILGGAWSAAGIVVAAAWWTDFFDGRVARSTSGSRLGEWDPHADTAVGFAVVAGLAAGGHVPGALWWLVIAGALAAAYLATRVFALSELVQALGYGPLLWLTALHSRAAFSVLLATILAILALDAERFRSHTLPAFFDGLTACRAAFRRKGPDS